MHESESVPSSVGAHPREEDVSEIVIDGANDIMTIVRELHGIVDKIRSQKKIAVTLPDRLTAGVFILMHVISINLNHCAIAAAQLSVIQEVVGVLPDVILLQEPYLIRGRVAYVNKNWRVVACYGGRTAIIVVNQDIDFVVDFETDVVTSISAVLGDQEYGLVSIYFSPAEDISINLLAAGKSRHKVIVKRPEGVAGNFEEVNKAHAKVYFDLDYDFLFDISNIDDSKLKDDDFCFTRDEIAGVIRRLRDKAAPGIDGIHSVSGIGPVQGQILNAIGIHTCSDMWEKRDLLDLLFSETSVDFYIRVALGIGSTVVKSDHVQKSIGNEHTFREIHHPADLHRKCQELCDELIEDLKSHNMLGKVVILKFKTADFQTHTRNHSLSHYTSDAEIVYKAAKKLIDAEITAVAPRLLKLRLMGVRMANLVYEDSVPQSEKQLVKLKDFIQSKSLNIDKKTSPVKSLLTNFTCPDSYTDCKIDHVDVCKSASSILENIPREHWNNKSLNCCDVSENSLSSPSFNNGVEISSPVMSYSCPVCRLNQNFNNLIELNAHIDNCLNKVAIKEILAEDSLGSSKRKLPQHKKQSLKKIKTEKKIEEYFRRNVI
ncbi:uncharacterized protein LOC118185881 [Stegodyphus dumicola]|uniref:uncharacterized protein LOC118185881 n=1 Tax=Stegodyphus dumicola TaxID=202533 RepID=UPI0015B2E4A2|nr:uncharacterized protein LOC118185881 [Stegodyphus dumicola]